MTTARVTIIDVDSPLSGRQEATRWLSQAGEEHLEQSIAILNRALHVFRLVTADAYVHPISRRQALVARIGFGAGEQVADGQWTEALELLDRGPRLRRLKVLQPQARLAAVLTGRERALACEELVLRARLDLDQERPREAALQLMVALDASLAELATDPTAPMLADRLAELRDRRPGVAAAAQQALAGELDEEQTEQVEHVLGRVEAALRARAVANA